MTIDMEFLAGHGTYTLLFYVHKEVTVKVGSLGQQTFPVGTYTYTGSALGNGASLKNRVARHLEKEKRHFWHIDYVLAEESVSVDVVFAFETSLKVECTINQQIKKLGGKVQIKGFGASDCRMGCKSHLLFFPDNESFDLLVQNLVDYLKSVSGVLAIYVTRQ